MVSVWGIGVVVINRIFGFKFFFFNIFFWFILKWCCLLVIIKFNWWKLIFCCIKVWVFIIMLILLLVSFLRIRWCFFVLVEFVNKVVCIFNGLNNCCKFFMCCCVKILVGIINVFWKLVVMVVYSVIAVIIVFLFFMLFWSNCCICFGFCKFW